MWQKGLHWLFCLCLLSGLFVLQAQEPTRHSEAIARLEASIARALEQQELAGITVAYIYNGVEWSQGYGYADLENSVPAQRESSYRMASVSKPMTAVGILKLVEQGKVDPDAEVQTYLPDFPRKPWPITVRQLLGHLGGISHYKDYAAEANTTRDMTTPEALAIFKDWDLIAEPGTRYSYTTYGYNLLGAILESAAGRSYQKFMTDEVWGPLQMPHTTVDYLHQLIPHRVGAYRKVDGRIENTTPVSTSLKIAGGGTRSTALEMARFADGLSNGKVLREATRREMWTAMATRDQLSTGYGMGWSIGSFNGHFMVSHSGAQEGTRTYLMHLPGSRLTVAAACNLEQAKPWDFGRELAAGLLGEVWNSPALYFFDNGDQLLAKALDWCFRDGLGYYSWQKAVYKGEPAAGFALLNRLAEDETVLIDAQNPRGGQLMTVAGSWMASRIAAAGVDLAGVHQGGAIPFAAAYIQAAQKQPDIPAAVHFHSSRQQKILKWAQEIALLEQSGANRLSIQAGDNPQELQRQMSKAFGKSPIYPDYSAALAEAGRKAYADNNQAKALGFAELSMRFYRKSARVGGQLGILQVLTGAVNKGRKSLLASAKSEPDGVVSAANLNNVAYWAKGLGKPAAALQLLVIACELHPGNANLCDSAGEMALASGDRTAAITWYKKALQIDPDFQSAKDMLQKINAM